MRLAILAGGDGWHVRDLLRAAAALGHAAEFVDFRGLRTGVALGTDPLARFDAVLVRTMPLGSLEQIVFRMDVLHTLAARGVPVVNPPRALEICIDKYLASARLDAAGLPVPPTVLCQTVDDALQAFEALGGDVVVKPLFGAEGRGMLRVADVDTAWRVFRTLERLQAVLYIQKFIAHPGWDLRVFVLGGQVLAAMRRSSKDNWRTNVAQGGSAEPVVAGEAERVLALRAAQATGVIAGGVDLLPGPDGRLYVLEVNGVPGWRALSRVCGVDVAAELVRQIGRQS